MDEFEFVAVHLTSNIVNFIIDELMNDSDDENEEDNYLSLEKIDNYAEITIPNFKDNQFKEHFRMFPETFELLLNFLHNSDEEIHKIKRGHPEISLEKQTLMTLWCLANIECFRSVADRFGISKSCCWMNLYKTASRLFKVNKKYKIIAFPSEERALQIINDFETVNGFPGIIGVIDGCHIQIQKPVEYPNSYINRKGFPSVLLQGICDKNKLFIDVYCGEPGSIHDSRLFSKSDIGQRITTGEIQFPNDSHLIGDLAYKLSIKLVVGFKDNGHLTEPQKMFNKILSQVRVVIENAFGILKARFRRLKMMETERLDLISVLIVAACILHNICLMQNDLWHEQDEMDDDDILGNNNNNALEDREAIVKRNNLVNFLYRDDALLQG